MANENERNGGQTRREFLERSAGLTAGLVGGLGALVMSWAVSAYLFEMPWQPSPGTVVLGIVLTSVVVGVVGVLASLDVVRRRPLGVLRAE